MQGHGYGFGWEKGERGMLSHTKYNIMIVFFSLILISSAYAALTPVVHAESSSNLTLKQQESLAVSNDVVVSTSQNTSPPKKVVAKLYTWAFSLKKTYAITLYLTVAS